MKVLQINSTVNTGSTGRITEEIGHLLLANDNESYIAYGRGNSKSESKLIHIGNKLDIYGHIAHTRLFDNHGFGSKSSTRKLIKSIHGLFDVIHLHNIHGYYINTGQLFYFLKSTNVPVVWTFHDSWPYTGHCTFYESVGCIKWQTECDVCPKTRMYPTSLFMDQSKRNFNEKKNMYGNIDNLVIVTPSNWLKNEVKKSFLKDIRIIHIANGINLKRFKPNDIYQEEKIVLGVASIWDKRKGLSDCIKLAKLLPQDMQIVLIGLSSAQISGLPTNIKGIKRTENLEELVLWYNRAMVFVNPTLQDNFPTTNLEALGCGTPVITYNTGGSPEAIDDKTGFVVEKGDVTGILQAIQQIESKGKEHYSAKCRQRAEQLFNKDDRYADYLKLYEEVLAIDA